MLSLISDWTLLPGLSVQIRFAGEEVCAGIIDCVTPDGEILWIDSGAGMRRLVEKPFGYEAWLDTDDEAILYKISHQGQDDSHPLTYKVLPVEPSCGGASTTRPARPASVETPQTRGS